MAWIESHQEMARHPKTRRVAVRLGISKAAVIGHLHLLWWWTLDFAPDGDLSGFEAEEIASVAEWEGDAEQFLQALLDTGWLDEGRRVHNWGDYAGRIVNLREDNRERQRRCREKKRDVVPPGGDDVAGVPRAGRTNVAAKAQACCPDVPEKSQTRNGGMKVASPLRNADVTAMSQLCHADVTVTSQLRHGATQPDQTEQNRTEPNRERVARGRAGGPAERSGGVPSLSRSREVVGEPAPVGGGHSGRGGDVLPRDGKPALSGGEARRGADSVPAEGNASGEAGRFSPEAGRSLRGAGNSIPPDSGDLRERREPGRGDGQVVSARADARPRAAGADEREAFGGADRLSGSRALLPDREGSLTDEALVRAHSLPEELEASRVDGRGAPRGGKLAERESHAPLRDGEGALPDEGPVGADSLQAGPGVESLPAESLDVMGLSREPGESPGGGRGAARGDAQLARENGRALPGAGVLPDGAEPSGDGGRFSSEGPGVLSEGLDAVVDPGRLSSQICESLLAGAASPDAGGSSRSAAVFSSGEGEAIRPAQALSSGRGEPLADGAGGSGEGGASRPKVAALRVEGEDFSPAGGALPGEPLAREESFAEGGGDVPPMGDEAREALRQDAAFREAWRGRRLHLADLGRAVMSRGQERALLRECARRGPARAVEVISYSITKGAKNLIWDDAPRAKRPPQSTGAKARVPNPEGWPEWLAAEYPDRVGIDYSDAPESVQGEFRRALQKGN